MEWWTWLMIGVVVLVLMLWVASALGRGRLRAAFGPEYDRAVERADSRREAERALRARLRRHRSLELKPLEPDDVMLPEIVAAFAPVTWMPSLPLPLMRKSEIVIGSALLMITPAPLKFPTTAPRLNAAVTPSVMSSPRSDE